MSNKLQGHSILMPTFITMVFTRCEAGSLPRMMFTNLVTSLTVTPSQQGGKRKNLRHFHIQFSVDSNECMEFRCKVNHFQAINHRFHEKFAPTSSFPKGVS